MTELEKYCCSIDKIIINEESKVDGNSLIKKSMNLYITTISEGK